MYFPLSLVHYPPSTDFSFPLSRTSRWKPHELRPTLFLPWTFSQGDQSKCNWDLSVRMEAGVSAGVPLAKSWFWASPLLVRGCPCWAEALWSGRWQVWCPGLSWVFWTHGESLRPLFQGHPILPKLLDGRGGPRWQPQRYSSASSPAVGTWVFEGAGKAMGRLWFSPRWILCYYQEVEIYCFHYLYWFGCFHWKKQNRK